MYVLITAIILGLGLFGCVKFKAPPEPPKVEAKIECPKPPVLSHCILWKKQKYCRE